jgi:hypothetical protein
MMLIGIMPSIRNLLPTLPEIMVGKREIRKLTSGILFFGGALAFS